MTDVVAEVKDVVEKEVEKIKKDDVVEEGDVEKKNGDAKDKEVTETETEKNGEDAAEKVEVENGAAVKENGVSEEKTEDTKDEGEVCGVKRKSEVGLESSEDAAVEPTESKKQKVEETAEPEVAANGVC